MSEFEIPEAMDAATAFIEGLLKSPLLHGDEEHRVWLTAELRTHIPALAAVIDDAIDEECGRWQEGIYRLLNEKQFGLVAIDGGGCDSGDPLDFSLAEIGQGLSQLLDRLDEATAAPTLTAAPDAPSSEKQSPPKEEETFLETGKQ